MSSERFEKKQRAGVLGHAAALQLRLETVDGPAAVGVDQVAHELVGVRVDPHEITVIAASSHEHMFARAADATGPAAG